jgi:hypothetical protein
VTLECRVVERRLPSLVLRLVGGGYVYQINQ